MNFFVRRQSNLYFLRLFRHCIIEVIIILIRHRATPISYTTFQLQQLTILLQTPYQQTACKSKDGRMPNPILKNSSQCWASSSTCEYCKWQKAADDGSR